eukprot:3689063-Rhodomonas_salina.1
MPSQEIDLNGPLLPGNLRCPRSLRQGEDRGKGTAAWFEHCHFVLSSLNTVTLYSRHSASSQQGGMDLQGAYLRFWFLSGALTGVAKSGGRRGIIKLPQGHLKWDRIHLVQFCRNLHGIGNHAIVLLRRCAMSYSSAGVSDFPSRSDGR